MTKQKSKIISVILSLVMLMQFAAAANDKPTDLATEHIPLSGEEFEAMSALGFLTEAIKNSSADAFVSRSEFVGNLFKVAGYTGNEYKSSEIPFIDISTDTPYKDEICFFYDAGFVKGNGDGLFSPDDSITYAEALKMIVDVLGYKEYTSVKYGAYPASYIAAAQRLKIVKGVSMGNGSEKLAAKDAVRLLYNAARTNVMEEASYNTLGEAFFETASTELMSKNNKIYYDEGLVTNNGILSWKTGERLENRAVIGNREMKISDGSSLYDLLGYNVKYFYKDSDGENIFLWATPRNTDDVTLIKSEELLPDDSSYGQNAIVYSDGKKRKIMNISDDASVIYNNSVRNVYSVLKPKSGTMKFFDYNGDNKADLVVVEEFKNIYAKKITQNGNYIIGKYDTSIYLDDYKNVKIYDNGKETELSNLRNNCVLSYVESLDKEYIFIYANETGKTDTLFAIGEKDGKQTYVFSDNEYIMAASYADLLADGIFAAINPQIGRSYKYCLDMAGNIADIEEGSDNKLQYAFLIDAAPEDKPLGDANAAYVRLLLTNGEKITAKTSKKIKLNGVKNKTGADLLADMRLTTAAGEIENQVVQVTLNSENNITEFNFADDNTNHPYGYDKEKFTVDFSSKELKGIANKTSTATYYSNSVDMFNLKYFVNKTTVCFVKYLDLNEDEPFGIKNATDFSNGSHPVAALYDANEKLEIGAMAVYQGATGASGEIMLVDNVRYVNRDGESRLQISGIYKGEYKTFTERFEGAVTTSIKRGDAIRLALLQNELVGVAVIKSLKTDRTPCLLDYKGDVLTGKYGGTGMIFGEIYARGANNITVLNPDEYAEDYEKLTSASFSMQMYTATYISVYDTVNDVIRVGEMRDFNQISTPMKNGTLKDNERNVKVLLRTDQNHIKDAVIVYY